jgi:hypothetical protein
MIYTSCEKTDEKNEFRVFVWDIDENGVRSILYLVEGHLEQIHEHVTTLYGHDIQVMNYLTAEYETPEFMSITDAWKTCADQYARGIHKPYRLILMAGKQMVYEKELGQEIPDDLQSCGIIEYNGDRYSYAALSFSDYSLKFVKTDTYKLED